MFVNPLFVFIVCFFCRVGQSCLSSKFILVFLNMHYQFLEVFVSVLLSSFFLRTAPPQNFFLIHLIVSLFLSVPLFFFSFHSLTTKEPLFKLWLFLTHIYFSLLILSAFDVPSRILVSLHSIISPTSCSHSLHPKTLRSFCHPTYYHIRNILTIVFTLTPYQLPVLLKYLSFFPPSFHSFLLNRSY